MKDVVDRIKAYLDEPKQPDEKITLRELGLQMMKDGNSILEACDELEADIVRTMHFCRQARSDAVDMIAVGRELAG